MTDYPDQTTIKGRTLTKESVLKLLDDTEYFERTVHEFVRISNNQYTELWWI